MTAPLHTAIAGAPLADAKAAVILLHGRGASAESMLALTNVLAQPDVAYLAPQAEGGTWYPYSFLAPFEQNEPYLSRSLAAIEALFENLAGQEFGPERIALIGFSQGGCLGLEFAAGHATRYGAVIGLSAGLIGPVDTPRDYDGSFAGTPVFLGCSDIDAHIPLARVRESSKVFDDLGGEVTERIYPGMGHTINDDEIGHVRTVLAGLLRGLREDRHHPHRNKKESRHHVQISRRADT